MVGLPAQLIPIDVADLEEKDWEAHDGALGCPAQVGVDVVVML